MMTSAFKMLVLCILVLFAVQATAAASIDNGCVFPPLFLRLRLREQDHENV